MVSLVRVLKQNVEIVVVVDECWRLCWSILVMMMMAMMMMAISVGGVRWRDRLIPRDEKSCSERRFENGFYTTTTRFYFYFYFFYYQCGGRGAQFSISHTGNSILNASCLKSGLPLFFGQRQKGNIRRVKF